MFKIMDNYDLNTSLFSPSSTSPPSTRAVEDDTAPETQTQTQTHLYRARLILENHLYDELLTRYKLSITRLGELQEENEWLRLANEDLIRGFNRLFSTSEPLYATGDNHNVVGVSTNDAIIGTNSPTSVINYNNNNDHEERFLLPKSISIPSLGYFKLKKSSPSTPTTTSMATLSNLSIRPFQDVNATRLRVRRDVDKAIEMDVYNQGMYKTELCNKWQETNTCPYNDHCRFAHGLSELRPVMRHPRYKTQVCRMVLSGITCPYGHRCHFRHSM